MQEDQQQRPTQKVAAPKTLRPPILPNFRKNPKGTLFSPDSHKPVHEKVSQDRAPETNAILSPKMDLKANKLTQRLLVKIGKKRENSIEQDSAF
jgi:hypothetical protein